MRKIFLIFLWIILLSCSQHGEPEGITYSFDVLNPDSEYIVIVGDTQYYYQDGNYEFLKKSIRWVSEAIRAGYKIKLVLHPGDITDINSKKEWDYFQKVFTFLESDVLVVYCTGNHDYDFVNIEGKIGIENRNSSKYNLYINYKEKDLISTYNGDITNAALKIAIQGEQYLVLSLEFGPREEVLQWADKIIKQYSSKKVIILTHAYLFKNDIVYTYSKYGSGQPWNPKSYFFSKDVNDGSEVWEKIIRYNNNVKMVVCGHNSFSGFSTALNDSGNNVIKIRFDPSNKPNGGDGWLQLLEFRQFDREFKDFSNSPNLRGFIYNPIYDLMDQESVGNFNVKF